jgi:hypothetical protein
MTIRAYAVGIKNAATGERRHVLVKLDKHEIWDCERQWATRGANGPGGPDSCIARGYALNHARVCAPAGFVPEMEPIDVKRIRVVEGNPEARPWQP